MKDLTHLKYRPDIDGLRGIAVLFVVMFHVFPQRFHGGFVGVDVFFVISGFLISTIIFNGLQHGNFSFAKFYNHRIRRIFPALIVVLIACYVFGWFGLMTRDYMRLGKHIAAGVCFISNIVLWRESGYFDTDSINKPLMHLWSLGIEEQFYLFWPILLWVFWRILQKNCLLVVTLFAALISFILNIRLIVSHDKISAFYLPQARFWELLTGSVLAWFALQKTNLFCKYPWLSNILGFFGAILLVFSFFVINEKFSFPGYWALFPVFGTVLIIAAGPGRHSWINLILSNRILVWFGLISYPLYLWHWPILSFVHNIFSGYIVPVNKVTVLSVSSYRIIRIATVFLSVMLAWITYILIEKPIRFGTYKRSKILLGLLIIVMIIVGCVGYDCFKRNGLRFRYTPTPYDDFISSSIQIVKHTNCITRIHNSSSGFSPKEVMCRTAKKPKIAIIGDSHMQIVYFSFVDKNTIIDESYRDVIGLSVSGCQPALDIGLSSESNNDLKCIKKMRVVVDLIKNDEEIKTVIIVGAGFYTTNITSKVSLVGYQKFIDELQRPWRKIVFVVDHPELNRQPIYCLLEEPLAIKRFFRKIIEKITKVRSFCQGINTDAWKDQSEYLSAVDALKKSNPGVVFFDSKSAICDNKKCNLSLVYDDHTHLSVYGGKLFITALVKKLAEDKLVLTSRVMQNEF